MFALNLTHASRLIAIGVAVVALIALTLVLVDPALAGNYGYYYRP
jgi:hypothetical protein